MSSSDNDHECDWLFLRFYAVLFKAHPFASWEQIDELYGKPFLDSEKMRQRLEDDEEDKETIRDWPETRWILRDRGRVTPAPQ